MSTRDALEALVAAAALVGAVAWLDLRCLADLSQTSDLELRYLGRNAWAIVIVLAFPVGPMLYLACAKGPLPRP